MSSLSWYEEECMYLTITSENKYGPLNTAVPIIQNVAGQDEGGISLIPVEFATVANAFYWNVAKYVNGAFNRTLYLIQTSSAPDKVYKQFCGVIDYSNEDVHDIMMDVMRSKFKDLKELNECKGKTVEFEGPSPIPSDFYVKCFSELLK